MSKKEKKIIFIGTVASSIYGFRADLIDKLQQKNYQVYAFFSEYTSNEIEKIKKMGVFPKTYKLNRGGLNPFSDLLAAYTLFKEIKKIQPDIVFCYFTKSVIFGGLAAKLARAPKIIGMIEGLGFSFTEQPDKTPLKTRLIKLIQVFLYKFTLPLLDKVIFLNYDDKKDLIYKYNIKAKKTYILGGIGLKMEEYPYQEADISHDKGAVRFLFVGRLLKEKGIFDFIESAKLVKKIYPSSQFSMLGSLDVNNPGTLSIEQLEGLMKLGIINYLGQKDDVPKYITDHHVFVLPSYREGVSRSTQEAMAIGRAVITTNVPGCKETVVDGVNGFLVERWSPEALAAKMLYTMNIPETEREKLGKKARERIQEYYSLDVITQQWLDLYRK